MSRIKAYYIIELSLKAFYFADGSRTIRNMHIGVGWCQSGDTIFTATKALPCHRIELLL